MIIKNSEADVAAYAISGRIGWMGYPANIARTETVHMDRTNPTELNQNLDRT